MKRRCVQVEFTFGLSRRAVSRITRRRTGGYRRLANIAIVADVISGIVESVTVDVVISTSSVISIIATSISVVVISVRVVRITFSRRLVVTKCASLVLELAVPVDKDVLAERVLRAVQIEIHDGSGCSRPYSLGHKSRVDRRFSRLA